MEIEFLNKTLFGKYKLGNIIGKGSYSLVFSAQNLVDNNMVAVKIQEKSQIYGNLEKEAYYLYTLKGTGIPKIYSYGIYKKYYVLVEQLLGKSLEQLFNSDANRNINNIKRQKDIIIASIQVLDRIEFLHSKLILHLDIKPDNFLTGDPDSSLIYVIDFGFAKKYRSSRTGKHINYSKKGYFNGNLKYSSVNTMRGVSPSRREDLESLGYMIIYLYNKKLPWENLQSQDKNSLAQKIFELKKTIKMEHLCVNMPEEMIIYMNYVKSLKFEQEPNYNYLRELFQNLLKKFNLNERPHFSWINLPLYQKDSNSLSKSFKKRRQSPFTKILNKFMNKTYLEAKMPKMQLTSNLKLYSLENIKEKETETEAEAEKEKDKDKEKDKEKSLTQRKKDIPQMINNNNINNVNNGCDLEKAPPIIMNTVNGNENAKTNNMNIINKKFEIQKNRVILRNQYNNKININNKKYINTVQINSAKNKSSIIGNGHYSSSNKNSNDIADYQIPYNPSIRNNKNINYNFLITPFIANKTINLYSNNSNQINSGSSQQKTMPQNLFKKVAISQTNSSNNLNKISPIKSVPLNRNVNNMNFGFNNCNNFEKINKKSHLKNTNSYFENNITYKRKYLK